MLSGSWCASLFSFIVTVRGGLSDEPLGIGGCDGGRLSGGLLFALSANALEDGETRSGGGVRVDVKNVGVLDLLEKSHCRVLSVVSHGGGVGLANTWIIAGVLEDAAVPVSALAGVVNEVLAHGGQVLLVQSLLLLELKGSVREAAALFLAGVFANLTGKPKLAQFCLDFALPVALGDGRLIDLGSTLRGLSGRVLQGRDAVLEVRGAVAHDRGGLCVFG